MCFYHDHVTHLTKGKFQNWLLSKVIHHMVNRKSQMSKKDQFHNVYLGVLPLHQMKMQVLHTNNLQNLQNSLLQVELLHLLYTKEDSG